MAEGTLFKKIYGCIAAGSIGPALGEPARRLGGAAYDPFKGLCGPLEGAHYRVIEETYGKITELLLTLIGRNSPVGTMGLYSTSWPRTIHPA